MNTQLSEITREKLHAFAARRRLLIAVRGLCVGVVALITIMSLIAVLDALFVIRSQSLRWALSAGGYALVTLAVWFTCLRSLLHIPGPRELARLIEQAAPGLREDLISAVELGSAQSDPRFDSPVFRYLLQASVERRITGVSVQSLLPSGLIRGAALLAAIVLTGCAALLLVPDLQFADRLTRALLPSAPVDRISNTQVRIITPDPADTLVPHNDAVNVLVELSGDEADEVVLETLRDGDGAANNRIVLKPVGASRRYSGVVELGREPLSYRILAGDAVTRSYTIDTAARPHATVFVKTYRFPAFAEIEPVEVSEKHGHMEALEGTQVELLIDVDQPIGRGELRFDDEEGKTPAIALEPVGGGRWRARVPITQSMTYKVHLIAKATGFDNALDPPYEIVATPDLAPVVTVTTPAADVLAPPATPVQVQLSARDDLGLAGVSQWFRINGGEWTEMILAEKPGRQWSQEGEWDIDAMDLRAGDQIATRFVATDRAGNETQTSPVLVTVAASGFDPHRLASLNARRRVLAELTALRQSARQGAAAVAEGDAEGELQRRQLLMNASQAAARLREDAEPAMAAVIAAIKLDSGGSGAHDLVQLGLAISRVRDRLAGLSLTLLERAGAGDEQDELAHAIAAARGAMIEAADSLDPATQAFTEIVAADEADALLRDMMVLRREQQQIEPDALPDQPTSWQRLSRRQRLISAQAQQAIALAADSRGDAAKGLPRIGQMIAEARAEVDALLAKPPSKQTLTAAAAKMTQGLDAAHAELVTLARALGESAAAAQAKLGGSSYALDAMLAVIVADDGAMGEARPHWRTAGELLKAAGALNEARVDADAAFVADIGLLRRALVAIEHRLASEPQAEVEARLSRVAAAIRTLEAGHGVMELSTAAGTLTGQEKWMRSTAHAVTEHPRQWAWWLGRLPAIVAEMERAQLPSDAWAMLSGVPRTAPAQVLSVEMAARRAKAAVSRKRPAQMEELTVSLSQVKAMIADDMARARAVLAAEAPTLSEEMAALAEEARKLEAEAAAAAKEVDPAEVPAGQEEAARLAEAQAALDEKLAALNEALRHDANKQDAFTDEGRERARDADDAAAMIRDPAERAAAALDRAAAAADAPQQEAALTEAAGAEAGLATALDQLAEHFENLEAGKGEETRSALRDAERELGIKREMDAQFGRMERLAELADKSPREQLAELEQELKRNPAMRQELGEIARDAVADAKDDLNAAADQERRVAQDLAAAQAAKAQAKPDVARQMRALAERAKALAEEAAPIAEASKKGTAEAAAASAEAAGEALREGAEINPPADPKDHEAAAAAAQAMQEALREAAEQFEAAQKQALATAKQVRDAETEATAKIAIGSTPGKERLKAAEVLLHARNRQAAAKQAAAQARAARAKATDLAEKAQQLAQETAAAAGAGDDALAKGLAAQPQIAQAAQEAAQDAARAARHGQRMDNAAARALQETSEAVGRDAMKHIGESARQLAKAGEPADAQAAVERAGQSLADEASKLDPQVQAGPPAAGKGPQAQAKSQPQAGSPGAGASGANAEQSAKWMARALDELDRAIHEDANAAAGIDAQAMKQLLPKGMGKAADGGPQGGKGQQANAKQAGGEQAGGVQAGGEQGGAQAGGERAGGPQTGGEQGGDQKAAGQQAGGAAQAGGKPGGEQAGAQAGGKPGGGEQAGGSQAGESAQASSGGQPGKSAGAGEQGGAGSAAGEASQAVREAAQAQASAMAQARQGSAPGSATGSAPGSAGSPGAPGSPAGGEAMAAGGPKGEPRGSAPPGAQGSAGQGAAGKMAANEGAAEGTGQGDAGVGSRGRAGDTGALPDVRGLRPGDWGKLPARLARELMEGQRDEVPSEYRSQVEAYFRAIAQKAQRQQD